MCKTGLPVHAVTALGVDAAPSILEGRSSRLLRRPPASCLRGFPWQARWGKWATIDTVSDLKLDVQQVRYVTIASCK